MAQFKQWFEQDFTDKIEIRHCESVMFTGDDKGAVVGVRLFDNGAAYSGGGTVSGAVKRSDGGLVALTGTLSGNAASVVIPAAALACPGPIGVRIVLAQGSSTTTVLKAIYAVDDNNGVAVDPGTIIPSINDLITAINNAVASIPSDYSALLHTLAPDFSASTAYSAGDYVWYNGTLYRFTADHAAGAWAGTDATSAVVGNDLSNLKSALSATTRNLFDGISAFINCELENDKVTNTYTDSKANLQMQVIFRNGTTIVTGSNPRNITATGRQSFSVTPSGSGDNIFVKHNGSTRDISITMPLAFTAQAYTVSFDVDGYDPSTVGGMVISEIQVETGSTATAYVPHVTAVDMIAREDIAALDARNTAEHTELSDKIEQLQFGTVQMESGTFSDNDGVTKVSNSARIRTVYPIYVEQKNLVKIPSGYDAWIFRLNENKALISPYGSWLSGNVLAQTIMTSATKYLNIAFRNHSTQSSDISGEVGTVESGFEIQPQWFDAYKNATKNGYSKEIIPYIIEPNGWDGGGGALDSSKRVRTNDWFNIAKPCIIVNNNPAIGYNLIWGTVSGGSASNVGARGWIEGESVQDIPYVEGRSYKITAHFTGESENIVPMDYLESVHVFEADDNIIISDATLDPYWGKNVNTLQKLQGTMFAFGVQTDTHLLADASLKYCYPLKNLTKVMGLDFIANLGDIARGYPQDSTATMQSAITNLIDRYTEGVECPFLYALGNHEDGVLYTTETTEHDSLDEVLLAPELYAKTIAKVKNTCEIHQPNKGFYYYVDIDGVRVIVLNTRDIAWAAISAQDIGVSHHAISDAQIAWLSGTALDTELPVIVLSHVPLLASQTIESVDNVSGVISALEAFVEGGGTIIGCFAGHTHTAAQAVSNGINYVVFDDGGDFAELVFVDLANKVIKFRYIGYTSASDREDIEF